MKHINEREIQDYLDGENPEKNKDIQEHVENCIKCKRSVKNYGLLYNILKDDSDISLSGDFTKKVIEKIKKSPEYESGWSFMQLAFVFFGILICTASTLFFVNINSLKETFLSKLSLDPKVIESVRTTLNNVDINVGLLAAACLVVLFYFLFDSLFLQPKHKV